MGDDNTLDMFGETFVFELKEEFLNRVVNVEFCCGDHVKKAKNGRLIEVGKDFIELVADDEAIEVILFGEEKQIDEERVAKIIIPIDHVCSVEDPCRKKCDPCQDDAKAE
jgi:hypothetical protein